MVAAGSCVAAPLEASLLCNAAAAAGSFASLEGVKSQAFHQHIEATAAAARRHGGGGNTEFLQDKDHQVQENSCFGASDTATVAPMDSVVSSSAASRAASLNICAGGAPAEAASSGAAVILPALAVDAAAACPSSGRAASSEKVGSVDCDISSESSANSSSSCHCVCTDEVASPEDMQQHQEQRVSLATAAATKQTSILTISSEESPSTETSMSVSQPSSSSVRARRRSDGCTCDDNTSPTSSSSTTTVCGRESSTLLNDKDIGNIDENGDREAAEREDSNICPIHQVERDFPEGENTSSNSSSSRAASSAGTAAVDRMPHTFSEDSSINSSTEFVAAASGKQRDSTGCIQPPGGSSGGALLMLKGSDDVVAASVGSVSNTSPSAVAETEAMEPWSVFRESTESFAVAESSVAVVAEDVAARSSSTAAAVRESDAGNPAAVAAAAPEIDWKDAQGERQFFCGNQEQLPAKMQQLRDEPAKNDCFYLLASDLASDSRGQQQQQQNDAELHTTTRREQREESFLQEEKQKQKYIVQCDARLEYLLQRQDEGTMPSQNKGQQQEMESEEYTGCGSPLLHPPRETVSADTQGAATATGEAINAQQEQDNSLHLDLMWEQVFDDPYFHETAVTHASALSSSSRDAVKAMEEHTGDNREGEMKQDNQSVANGVNNHSMVVEAKQQQQEREQEEQQQQQADRSLHSTESTSSSAENSASSSTGATATTQPEVTPRRQKTSTVKEEEAADVALLHGFPDSRGVENSYVSLNWDVSLWQGVPLLEPQLRQQENRKQRHEEEQQEREPEDVMMTSLASQGSAALGEISFSEEENVAIVEGAQQQIVEEHTFSFGMWQKNHVASGKGNGMSSPCSSNRTKGESSSSASLAAISATQSPQCLSMSDVNSNCREEQQQSSAASAGAATNATPDMAYMHAKGDNGKKEGNPMEEDMFLCNTSSGSETAAGALGGDECRTGATAATSVAETATVTAAAEARLCDSSGEEDGEEHHSILDTCLSSVEDVTELSSSPSFSLWTEHRRFASPCAVTAAAPAAGGARLGSETTATAAPPGEEVTGETATEASEGAAGSVISTSCSFFFSNMTETACEEKSTSGCCAVIAGTGGESVGLCSSSSEEDEDESGQEEEASTEIFENGDGGDWSSRLSIEETTGCGDGLRAEGEGEDHRATALVPAYSAKRMLKKNIFCSSDPFQHEETVFIFDWDDTLLPSSWLSQKGLTLDSSNVEVDMWRKKLSAAAAHAEQTLYAARALGRVVIVTNAETGWIDLSCSKFMPDLAPLLRCFRIVSARSVYESSCCNTPFLWKVAAFTEELRRHFPVDTQRRWNVISVGDSTHEREALFSVCGRLGQFYNVTTKSLKLLEAPAVEDLHSQHELMLECLETVAKHKGNLDLCVASVLEAALKNDDYAGTPLPAGLERCTVGLHCLRYHPLAPEVVGRA